MVYGGYNGYVAVIKGMLRLLRVSGDYLEYVAGIYVCGGYSGQPPF